MSEIQSQVIDYTANGVALQGYLALPENTDSEIPGVIVVHEWNGHSEYVRSRAEQLAALGYVAFALDMYGTGKVAETPQESEALMNDLLQQPKQVVERFDAAMTLLQNHENVDSANIAAIGYCMGGAIVLNMARAGKPLKAVCSFHGLLQTETPMEKGTFTGRLGVFTGGADPMVTPDIVEGFQQEMQNAGVDLEFCSYPDVLHSFTNPVATERGEKFGLPLKYSESADHDSWAKMRVLLAQAFNQ